MQTGSPYTNPIPAGTVNLSFNVPEELAVKFRTEAAELKVTLGEHIVCGMVAYYGMAGDVEAQAFTQEQMARRKPRMAAFWKNLLHVLHPLNYLPGRG